MNTILITGCSTGFGRDAARHFVEQGWNVVATMRDPGRADLPPSPRLRILPLDVTDDGSIARVVAEASPIDALVNNAGIGWLNALEGTPMQAVRDIFETNTLGTLAVTQAFLPQFRERRAGVIVNVTSSVTYRPLPLLSVYTASKAAVNAFTESLALELQPFGIRAHLVLPGQAMQTAFGSNARARMQNAGGFPPAYAEQANAIFTRMQTDTSPKTTNADVCAAIWRAVTDPAAPMRIPAGTDAAQWAAAAEAG